MWPVRATSDFARWFEQRTASDREEIAIVVELLRIKGPQLSRPYADTLKGSKFDNMKELRVNAGKRAIRIMFAFDPSRSAILLIAGDKRGISEARFYRQLIARADRLYAEHLEAGDL